MRHRGASESHEAPEFIKAVLNRIAVPLREWLVNEAAFLWRCLMFRTTVIAITGSAGKGTATACLGSILSAHFETNWLPGGRNSLTARILLRTRFRHRFTVLEAGTDGPGAMLRAARFIRPDIAVVLRVLSIHRAAYPLAPLSKRAWLRHRCGHTGT